MNKCHHNCVLCRFLTKREQQLKQRRTYAEELLQWKQRLDFEEREIRRMERQAMADWHEDTPEVPQQKGVCACLSVSLGVFGLVLCFTATVLCSCRYLFFELVFY